jgi:hypothetical protein
MSDWITPTVSLGLRKILLLACLLCALPLIAQNKQPPSAPKYDPQAETKLKGTIEEVKLPPKAVRRKLPTFSSRAARTPSMYTSARSLFLRRWA